MQQPRTSRWYDVALVLLLGVFFWLFNQSILEHRFSGVDDYDLIKFRWHELKEWKEIPRAFVTDVFDKRGSMLYRPIQNVSHSIEAMLLGGDAPEARVFHRTNLMFGLLNIGLFFLLLRQHGFKRGSATFFGLLLIVHPLTVPVLAWIPGRADVMLLTFILLAWMTLRWYLRTRSWFSWAVHVFCMLLAFFTKDQAFAVIALFLIYLATLQAEDPPTEWRAYFRLPFWRDHFQETYRKHARLLIGWAACFALWKGLHMIAIYGKSPSLSFTVYELLTSYPELAAYAYFLFAPLNHIVFYEPGLREILFGTAGFTLFFFLLKYSKTPTAWKLFGLAWLAVWLVPTTLSTMVIAHRMYLPFIALPFLFQGYQQQWEHLARIRKAWWILGLTSYLVFLGYNNSVFRGYYENELIYHRNAFTRNAHVHELSHWIAYFYHLNGELDSAEKYYLHTLKLDSNKPATHMSLAEIANDRGNYDQADSLMRIEEQLNNDSCLITLYHAKFQAVRENYDTALLLAHRALTQHDTTYEKRNWNEAQQLIDSLQAKKRPVH